MGNAKISIAVMYFCLSWGFLSAASGAGFQWEAAGDGIREQNLNCVAAAPDDQETVFVSSDNAVYKSVNGGKTWDEILSFRTTGTIINTISVLFIDPLTVYAGTGDGLYRSSDGGAQWTRIFRGVGPQKNSVLSIAASPESPRSIAIGTEAGLFISEDNGGSWIKGQNLPSDTAIGFIITDSSDPSILYAAVENGLYRSANRGSGWKRVLDASDTFEDEDDFSASAEETGDSEEFEAHMPAGSIAVDSSGISLFYAPASGGLRISRDRGETWWRASSLGLGSKVIHHILFDNVEQSHVYAATDYGVFRYSTSSDVWEELYKGMVSSKAHYLALSRMKDDGRAALWAATEKGVFRAKIPDRGAETDSGSTQNDEQIEDVLSIFSHEPTIAEVREAAIVYAEVHPDKILKWRRAAAASAWLPDLKVEYSKGKDWQSSTYFYSTSSQKYKDDDITKGKDDGWSISANWELGELVWNSDQTSIDSRSRLVVQLRDDVLAEVTRLYFERRRLMVSILMSPPDKAADKIEQELRLQELTAGLDAMTGSYFSRKLNHGAEVEAQGSEN